MLKRVGQMLEMIRFSHTLFALPFAMLAAVMAWATVAFRWRDLVGVLLAMVFARSAAMAFNRLADRRLATLVRGELLACVRAAGPEEEAAHHQVHDDEPGGQEREDEDVGKVEIHRVQPGCRFGRRR